MSTTTIRREDLMFRIPYNEVAELDVLVGMTRDAWYAPTVVDQLADVRDPFYIPAHQGIYAGLADLTRRGALGSCFRVDAGRLVQHVPGLAAAIDCTVRRTHGSPHDLERRFERMLTDHSAPPLWSHLAGHRTILEHLVRLADRRARIADAYRTLLEASADAI